MEKNMLGQAHDRIAELEADVRRWRETADNYALHCGNACEQLEATEGERNALLAEAAGMREALIEAKCYIGMYRDEHEAVYGPHSYSDAAEIDKDVRLCESALTAPATTETLERVKQDEFNRGWRQAFAEVAASIPCDYKSLYGGELWVSKFEQALERVRREAKAEAFEEARRMAACLSSSVIEMELGFKRDSCKAAELRGAE